MTTTACDTKSKTRVVHTRIHQFNNKTGKCEWVKKRSQTVKCQNPCPKTKEYYTPCVLRKKALMRVTFKRSNGKDKCESVAVKVKVEKCENKTCNKECPRSKYTVKNCTKGEKNTFIYKVFYKSVNGKCQKQTKKFKQVSCACYKTKKHHIKVTIGRKCLAGYRQRDLHFYEERKGKCEHVKVTLRRIKCDKIPSKHKCSRRLRMKTTECDKKTGSRVMHVLVHRVNNKTGKCEWIKNRSKTVKCKNQCPKTREMYTPCIFRKKVLVRISFNAVKGECESVTVKLKTEHCGKSSNGCSKLKKYKSSLCINNTRVIEIQQYLPVNASSSKSSNKSSNSTKCAWKLTERKTVKCSGKRPCPRPVYKKSRCIIGKQAVVRISFHSKQGKCKAVKGVVKMVTCKRRKNCSRRKHIKVSICQNGKRLIELKKLKKSSKGVCEWKLVKKFHKKCKSYCPIPRTKKTRCLKERQYLFRTSYRKIANFCIPKVEKIKLSHCKVCPHRVRFVLKACRRNTTTSLVQITQQKCKTTEKVLNKNVSCNCYKQNKSGLTATLETKCQAGNRFAALVYFNAQSGKTCSRLTLRVKITKCKQGACRRRAMVRFSVCNKGYRTVEFLRRTNNKDKNLVKVGQCPMKMVRKTRFKCRNKCPGKSQMKKCIRGRKLAVLKEYKEVHGFCVVTKLRFKWTKCGNQTKNCSRRRRRIQRSKCKNGKAQIVMTRYVKDAKNQCVPKRSKIDVINCNGQCKRQIIPKLVSGQCKKSKKSKANNKNIYLISTRPKSNKCYHRIRYLGKIPCKDC